MDGGRGNGFRCIAIITHRAFNILAPIDLSRLLFDLVTSLRYLLLRAHHPGCILTLLVDLSTYFGTKCAAFDVEATFFSSQGEVTRFYKGALNKLNPPSNSCLYPPPNHL